MSEIRYNIGDSVWFPFDNGTKEQKGEIKWFSNVNEYAILGNVDKKIHFVKENEISIIAPHKRWLDPTEYKPDWEAQTKAIKKLEKQLEEELYDFKIGDEVLYYDGTHCNRNIRTGVITRIDYNPLFLYYEYSVRKLFTTVSKLYTERDIICKTRDAEEYSKRLGINLEPFAKATTNYERQYAEIKNVIEKWKPTAISHDYTIANIDYLSMYPTTDILTCDGFKGGKKFMEENKKMVIRTVTYKREIKDIIFSGPATVIKFNNQFDKEEKTVVKCQNGDEFDKTKGFLLALVKEFVDKKSWNNILRIIDSFEEEKNEKEKSIAEIFDSLPENVKNDIYVEIERASRPTRKFSGQDIVKLSKSNTGYIIERCRWNEDKKCWEYFCNNGRDYCRWYEEDRLVFA